MYSKNLAYLVGVIYGDGYIKNGTKSKKDKSPDYKISIELTDIKYLKEIIFPLFKKFTQTSSKVRTRKRKNKKESGILEIRNKKFYKLLTEKIKTHKGPKTKKIKIPKTIKNWPSSLQQEFIAGYFDTDGGFRGKTIGFTTKTKDFHIFTLETLMKNNINATKEKWINKKNKKEYFGIKIKKNNIDKFLNVFKLRNSKKLASIQAKFLCAGAGVVKRAGRK